MYSNAEGNLFSHCDQLIKDGKYKDAIEAAKDRKEILPALFELNPEHAAAIGAVIDRDYARSLLETLAANDRYSSAIAMAGQSKEVAYGLLNESILVQNEDGKTNTHYSINYLYEMNNGRRPPVYHHREAIHALGDQLIANDWYSEALDLIKKKCGTRSQIEQLSYLIESSDCPTVLKDRKKEIGVARKSYSTKTGDLLKIHVNHLMANADNREMQGIISKMIVKTINHLDKKGCDVATATRIVKLLMNAIKVNKDNLNMVNLLPSIKNILAAVVKLQAFETAEIGTQSRFATFFGATSPKGCRVPDPISGIRSELSEGSPNLTLVLGLISDTHPDKSCPDGRLESTHKFYQAVNNLLGESCMNVAEARGTAAPGASVGTDDL
ncbi:MAG: hypothetical protein CMF50_09025 [Legionellales bacterium]|nr:hypothetical protein [Legionellales bacterium]|tara:strand:- start:4811 stop:5959 length:1149 start_codon:yes stop_codon:yes gene_type:complete